MKNKRESFNRGSCKTLKESPYFIFLFIDDDVSNWTYQEVRNYIDNQIKPNISFIEQQGKKYGIELNIDWGYYYTKETRTVRYHGNILSETSKGKVQEDIMDQIAKSLTFTSKTAMHRYLKELRNAKQIAYIAVLNKPGRSYALKHTFANNSHYLEHCICFSKYSSGRSEDFTGTITHEVFHLFGAEDLYNARNKRPKREEMAKKLCPNDIMFTANLNIKENEINDFTAYTIGWLDEMPIEYDCEDWWE